MSGLNPAWIAMLVAFQREDISRDERRLQAAVSRAQMNQRMADYILERKRGVLRVLEMQQRQLAKASNDAQPDDDIEAFDQAVGART